jgi:hypothetical protein
MSVAGDGRWHPGLGDPYVTGWVTVAAYAIAMLLGYLCYRNSVEGAERKFWLATAFVMAVFGINKQLDVQTWFTEVAREMALAQGWYAYRRQMQVAFIVGLLVGGLGLRTWLNLKLSSLRAHVRRAGAGLLLLSVFVVMRAASYHHVDVLLGISWAGARINVVVELGALLVIVWAAIGSLRNPSG